MNGLTRPFLDYKYMRYFGRTPYIVLVLASLVVTTGIFIFASYWLAVWVDAYGKDVAVNILYYAGIYGALNGLVAVTHGVSYLLFARGSWHAARRLHHDLIRAVLGASLSWWKNMPVGRVVNRFSRDVKTM